MIEVATTVSMVLLGAAGLLIFTAIVRGRALADRAIALDGLVAVVLNGLAVAAVRTGEPTLVVLALIICLLGFIGTTTVARYIERRGEARLPSTPAGPSGLTATAEGDGRA